MIETWKRIAGFEIYEISDFGRIRKDGVILRTSISPRLGYYVKRLREYKKMIYIHRAIATAFVANPNSYPCVNHKDRNKANNDVSNLEWCTHRQNIQHACDHARANGGTWNPKGEDSPKSKLKREHIPLIKEAYAAGFSQQKIAGYFKVRKQSIASVLHGRNWAHV